MNVQLHVFTRFPRSVTGFTVEDVPETGRTLSDRVTNGSDTLFVAAGR